MGNLRNLKRNLDPYRRAIAEAMDKKLKERDLDHFKNRRSERRPFVKKVVVAEEKKNASCLPEDPLIIGKAPESNYPENQGMGNAIGAALEKKK